MNGHGHAEDDEALRPFIEWKYNTDNKFEESRSKLPKLDIL